MSTYVMFLRGINVGASTRVSMPRLRELAEGLGWTDVSTYINSGNLFADCGRAAIFAVASLVAIPLFVLIQLIPRVSFLQILIL